MDTKRVVIIDDEMVLGQLLQAAFATLSGHIEVSVVPNAEEATKEIKKTDTQLVVADVKLPGISGIEFATQLKQKSPNIRIILVSGLKDPDLKEKALATGADAYFPKPVDMRNFLETSSKLLGLIPQTAKLTSKEVIDIRSDLLVDLLINIRQDLSAMAVTMITEQGKVIGSAGDPPEGNLAENIIPYLLALTSPLNRLSSTMQPEVPENVISIRGSQYDLVVSPVSGFVLIVFLKHVKSSVRMAIVFDSLVSATGELQQKINNIGQNYPVENTPAVEKMLKQTGSLKLPEPTIPAIEVAQPAEADVTADFENLFNSLTKKKLKSEEVESYWETATNKARHIESKEAGLLSFEEANQLGLTPKDEQT
jgi:CheY-like chemotaxis protein